MKYSTGLVDFLFGKRVALQVPQDDGTTRQVRVTECWLKQMSAEGKVSILDSPPNAVPFHIIGTDGSETRHLRIGEDIPEEKYKQLADPETGALYGLCYYEEGVPRTIAIPKNQWEQAKAQFEGIDKSVHEAMRKSIEDLESC